MTVWLVSTTALVAVSVTVEADSAEEALERAASLPTKKWHLGEVFGDVDLDGEVSVTEAAPMRKRRAAPPALQCTSTLRVEPSAPGEWTLTCGGAR